MNEERDPLTEKVIGLAIELHKSLGPGILESAYEECLAYDINQAGLHVQRQVVIPIQYKTLHIPGAFRVDLIVEKRLVIEIKSVEKLLPIHDTQLLTYLRLTGIRTGLLLNFHANYLKDGMKRMVL